MEQSVDKTQIIFSFLEYLQDLKKDASLNEDSLESIDVATQCLSTAFGLDLNDEQQRQKHSLASHQTNFSQVFSLGLNGKQKITEAVEQLHKKQQELSQKLGDPNDIETKFAHYLQAVKQKGFFAGVNPGTQEYEQRFLRARQKFVEKYHPNAASSGTTTTATNVESPKPATEAVPPSDDAIKQAETLKMEGNNFLSAKEYDQAIDRYTKAIQLNPNNAIYYSNRAAAYSHLGLHEKAIDDCNQSIRIDPKYNKAYGRLGLAYFSMGNYEAAVEQYRKGLELEPSSTTLKASLEAAEKKLNKSTSTTSSNTTANTGASGASPNFNDMFNNPDMMNQLGGLFGGGGAGGGLGGILNNPMFQNVAQQMMNNPQMMNMATNMMQNPEMMSSMMNMFGGANQNQNPQ